MSKKGQKVTPNKPFSLKPVVAFLLYLFALFFGSALFPLATGLSLPIALISCGVGTLLFMVITRGKMTFFLSANWMFLPAILLIMNPDAAEAVGSFAWNQAMGGWVVAVWIAGLIYIVLASLVRLFGADKVARFFPRRLIGPLVIVAGLTAMAGIFESDIISPIRDFGASAYKTWIIFGVSLLSTLLFFAFKKTRSVFRLAPAGIGVIAGLLTTLVLDGTELLFLSKDLGQTLLLGPLSQGSGQASLFVFQDLETYFGFWSYLHFDWSSILSVIPLVLLAFGVHLVTVDRMDKKAETTLATEPGIDRTLVTEGIFTMASGLLSGVPMSLALGNDTLLRNDKPSRQGALITASLVLILLAIFEYGTFLQSVFPRAAVAGSLLGVLGFIALRGIALTFPHGFKISKGNLVLALLIVAFGLGLSGLEFYNSLTHRLDAFLIPGGILLSPLSVCVALFFLVHVIWTLGQTKRP